MKSLDSAMGIALGVLIAGIALGFAFKVDPVRISVFAFAVIGTSGGAMYARRSQQDPAGLALVVGTIVSLLALTLSFFVTATHVGAAVFTFVACLVTLVYCIEDLKPDAPDWGIGNLHSAAVAAMFLTFFTVGLIVGSWSEKAWNREKERYGNVKGYFD